MADPYDSKPGMTGWYDPAQLIRTGIRVASATMFGRMLDRRELMAGLDPLDVKDFKNTHDHSRDSKEIWIDYVADTGDGWWPTYAVARLVARDKLVVDGTALPRGSVLILGGDQVYPTPSPDEYARRLRNPFEAALMTELQKKEIEGGIVYATPGNHDWYDGLTAFAHLFCTRRPNSNTGVGNRGRKVCGREARQTRSYFALKLPSNWWLCGIDIRLDGDVDPMQIEFFDFVAQKCMTNGANIILCTAQPVWNLLDQLDPKVVFKSFSFFCSVITGEISKLRTYRSEDRKNQHNLRLVLTGDAHHFTHYIGGVSGKAGKGTSNANEVQYITCGLGGAFLHPTHWTEPFRHFDWEHRPPPPLAQSAAPKKSAKGGKTVFDWTFTRQSVYPPESTCKRLAFRNLLFGYLNPQFAVTMGIIAAFVAWLLINGADLIGIDFEKLRGESLTEMLDDFVRVFFATPWAITVAFGILFAVIYFCAAKGWLRYVIGGGHALIQMLTYLSWLFVVARWLPYGDTRLGFVLYAGAGGFLSAPLILGLYLLIALNCFKTHWNEAFSSLRIEGYKGFLRLHIDSAGDLSIYPIVMDAVPRKMNAALEPKLVTAPIKILNQVVGS